MSAQTKRLNNLYATGLLSLSMMLATQVNAGSLIGSKHDFSTLTPNWTQEICTVCHTPHNANNGVGANTPLWGHATSNPAGFTMYTGVTTTNGTNSFDATPATSPQGTSLLCLSCHDGTIALDSFGGNINNNAGVKMTGASMLGTDLTNDHPISFIYNTALSQTDPSLRDPATWPVTTEAGPNGQAGITGTIQTVLLDGDRVECSSCHDVHNTFTGAQPKMLKISMASSKLCTTCHNK